MRQIHFQNFGELPYAVEEAFNRLMVNVNFTGKDIKTILISSTYPNEGKSFVAAHLWRKLAMAGYKCILVDSDLRNSVLKERYQYECDEEIKGITYYLSGKISLEEAVYSTDLENADILPLTKKILNSTTLLQGDGYTEMLATLREKYDYVIVDAAPLEAVADGERIASICDGALLVIRANSTSRHDIRQSMNLLQRANCVLLGTVLNRAQTGGYYSKYGYGKYGYGKYGYGRYGYGKYGYGEYGAENQNEEG